MPGRIGHIVRYQLPALLWAGGIFIASSIPGAHIPRLFLAINDKVIHAGLFFVLGLLIYRALEPRIPVQGIQWGRIVLSVLVVITYGISDEFHQGFVPGRWVDFKDVLADTIGAVLSAGVIVISTVRTLRMIRKAPDNS